MAQLSSNSEVCNTEALRVGLDNSSICNMQNPNYYDNNVRLRGGADPEDDVGADELRMPGVDEPDIESQSTKVKPPPKPATASPPENQIESKMKKLKRIFNYAKIVILAIIWLIYTIFMMTNKEQDLKARLLSIPPRNESKMYKLPVNNDIAHVGVLIQAAFGEHDDIDPSDKTVTPFLAIKAVRGYIDGMTQEEIDSRTISKVWASEIMPAKDLHRASLKKKKFVLDLDMKENKDITKSNTDDTLYLKIISNVDTYVTIKVWINVSPIDKTNGIICGAIILVFLYVMIIWEVINRTFASIICATLSLGVLAAFDNRPNLQTLVTWIDIETLMLLFGMMVLVAILAESGIFDYLAVYAYKITKGKVWPLIICLCLFGSFCSAFLDNVTMMLLVTPVVIRLCEVLQLNPVPVLMCLVMISNVGAALTPVGDPPNVIITTNSYISKRDVHFGNFFLHMLPGVLLATLQSFIQLRLTFRRESSLRVKGPKKMEELRHEIQVWERAAAGLTAYSKEEEMVRDTIKKKADVLNRRLTATVDGVAPPMPTYEETLQQLTHAYPIRDKLLLLKSTIAFVFVIILFFLHSVPNLHHLSLGWTALIGALLLLIIADVKDIEAILGRVEWSTLLFFASLFVVMESLSQLGLIDVLGNFVIKIILMISPEYRLMVALIIVLWVSAIASAFLDNIPVATMMVRIIVSLAQNQNLNLPLHPLVWALAFGACFGGNGTLIGASANVVGAGVAEQHGYKIAFIEFFIVGFPLMLGNIIVATLYLLLAHVAFQWH